MSQKLYIRVILNKILSYKGGLKIVNIKETAKAHIGKISSKGKETAKKHITTIKSTGSKFKSEVKKNVLKAILAAFAFVIALIWRDAIKAGIDEVKNRVGIEGTGYIYQITIALIVTLVCVIGIMVVSRIKGKEDVKK